MDTDHQGLAAALQQLGRDRNPTAWAHIVACCAPASERLARRLAGNADVAHDAVQEAWLQIRDGAKCFAPRGVDPDAGAWRWIMRVTANATLMWMRRHRRRALPLHAEFEPIAPEPPEHDRDLSDALRRALAELPEDQRTAVVLHHLSGLDFIAVGAASGCSAATAKMRAHRAIERLRKQLRPAGAALSVLAVTSALTALPAAEGAGSVPFATLLTSGAKAKLATASVFGGMTMSMKMILLGLALIVVGCGFAVAQDIAPNTTTIPAQAQIVDVAPLNIPPPYAALIHAVDQRIWPQDTAPTSGIEQSWAAICLIGDLGNGGFAAPALQPFISAHRWVSDPTIDVSWTRRQAFDAFALKTDTTWRMRGNGIDCLPMSLAKLLSTPLDGAFLPSGNRFMWQAWMQQSLAMPVSFAPQLLAKLDDKTMYRILPGKTTVEAVINGLAHAWRESVCLKPAEHELQILERPGDPTFAPPYESQASWIVYNQPLPALIQKVVSIDFSNVPLTDVAKALEQMTGVAIDISDIRPADHQRISLRMSGIELRIACALICKGHDMRCDILADRIRFTNHASAAGSSGNASSPHAAPAPPADDSSPPHLWHILGIPTPHIALVVS